MNEATKKILKQLDDMIIDMDLDNSMARPTGLEIIEMLEDARAFIEDEVWWAEEQYIPDEAQEAG